VQSFSPKYINQIRFHPSTAWYISQCGEALGITQRELAEKIGIDESLMSKIVHYNFDDFTIDRLVKYLAILFPRADLKISIKKKKKVA
jgi:predicted XRE-type DNA-binding protein